MRGHYQTRTTELATGMLLLCNQGGKLQTAGTLIRIIIMDMDMVSIMAWSKTSKRRSILPQQYCSTVYWQYIGVQVMNIRY